MACEFVCDGCGRRARGQQVGESVHGAVFVLPAGWTKATFQGRELQVCRMACAHTAELKLGLKPAPVIGGPR